MFKRMMMAWVTVGKTFGVWFSTLFTGLAFLFLRVSVAIGMVLDPLFFPRLRRTRVKAPIVIVGNPRSGTTFLQRLMARDTANFSCLKMWEIFFAPSITSRNTSSVRRVATNGVEGPVHTRVTLSASSFRRFASRAPISTAAHT